MKRILTFVLTLAAVCCMAEKASVRIDLDGRANKIELKPDVCQNVTMENPRWLGDKKQFCLSAISKPTVGKEWQEFFISFIPQQDGKVKLILKGPWHKPEKAQNNLPVWIAYDNLEIIGAESQNTDFELESVNGIFDGWSGSQANMAVYFALVNPGDTVLAMSLDHGGHLTHGHPMNFSGMLYNIVPYGVNKETETIDYDEVARLAEQHKPKMILVGASAYPRTLDFPRFREIADAVGAKVFVDMAHIAGLVAAGEHPSPIPYADVVTSTTHKTLRGPRSGLILCKEEYIKTINSKIFPGLQGGPLEHVIAAKAICFKEAMSGDFKIYQQQVRKNAARLAAELANRGFRIVSGGTDNHLMLVDLRPKSSTGKEVANSLDRAMITVNKNMIPFDPEKPFITSGIRIGTPAVTTRGMKEAEMVRIADFINRAVAAKDDEAVLKSIGEEVKAFTRNFPLPHF